MRNIPKWSFPAEFYKDFRDLPLTNPSKWCIIILAVLESSMHRDFCYASVVQW